MEVFSSDSGQIVFYCSIYFESRRAGDDNHLELLW